MYYFKRMLYGEALAFFRKLHIVVFWKVRLNLRFVNRPKLATHLLIFLNAMPVSVVVSFPVLPSISLACLNHLSDCESLIVFPSADCRWCFGNQCLLWRALIKDIHWIHEMDIWWKNDIISLWIRSRNWLDSFVEYVEQQAVSFV